MTARNELQLTTDHTLVMRVLERNKITVHTHVGSVSLDFTSLSFTGRCSMGVQSRGFSLSYAPTVISNWRCQRRTNDG